MAVSQAIERLSRLRSRFRGWQIWGTDTRARMRVRVKYTRAPLPDGIRLMVDAANKIADIRNQAVIAQYEEQLSRA